MSKRKWYTRALYTMVALAMTVGLVLVPAAVASPDSEPAASPDLTDAECGSLQVGIGYGAVGVDMGTAVWDTTVVRPADTGSYSAKISPGATSLGLAAAKVPYGGDLTAFSILDETAMVFWTYYDTAGKTSFAALWLDTDADGVADLALLNKGWSAGTIPLAPNTWCDAHLSTAQAPVTWHVYGYTAATGALTSPVTLCDGVSYTGNDYKSLDDWAALVCAAPDGTFGDAEVLCVGQMIGGVPGSEDCYVYADDMVIDGVTYGMEPCYELEPDIAYNVKTADETFTVMDACGPVAPGLVSVWTVIKGEGTGEVIVVAGGGTEYGAVQTNFITVRMITMGDCIITADVAGIPVAVNAEKKWGEIYRTILTPDPLTGIVTGDTVVVDEFVEATFLPTPVAVHGAGGAKVTWWLIEAGVADANLIALKAYLDDFANFDISSDTSGYGCGRYGGWSPDPANPIAAPETFMATLYPVQAATDTDFIEAEGTPIADTTKTVTYTDHAVPDPTKEGHTNVTIEFDDPTTGRIEDVILVVLADYPLDKNGQNPVCVEYYTWLPPPPPPVIEKLPEILWAGEKDVIEWRLDVTSWSDDTQAVVFYLEDPSVGTFETLNPDFPVPGFPSPGFAYRDMAWGLVDTEGEYCGDYYAARTVLHSDKQGKANVIAQYLEYGAYGWEIVSQQGFLIYFLAFEEVELKNIGEDPTNEEAWESEGSTLSDLFLNNSSKLRLRVKGFFEDPVMKSPKPEKPQDLDGDGTTDIILPAGRWVLPDDYPTLALGKLLWDMMDTPVDDIVSYLDSNADKIETLGPYGDAACFEYVLADTSLTDAAAKAAYLEALVACYPVIGPFSKLQAVNEDGTAWDLCDITWVGRVPSMWPEVLADGNPIDALVDPVSGLPFGESCRVTVVPDGSITEEDANMPPAEILFAITDGNGLLADVNKADLYQIPEACDTDTGVVYTNPYYWQEIPANIIIPPMYGSGLAGYEWDSWGTDTTIDGPYRFWDKRSVWTSDELILMDIFDLTAVPTALKAYTDNHGEAWVKFTQKSFVSSTIKAVATYPYLIGDHLPLVSNPVVKISEDFKDPKVAWEKIDDMYDMLYVFVRDYDGDPAVCEPVDWNIDGIAGTIISLLTDTAGPCDNDCLDITCEGSIAADSRSAQSCTREMTSTEITKFTGATISVPLDRFHRELGEPGALLFDPTADELPVDYAIAGIKVSSSLGDDVDIIIKIHDCWEDVEVVIDEDQILYFGDVVPDDFVDWNLANGVDVAPPWINIWTYPASAATVTLLDVDATMPDGLLIWSEDLKFYKKGWGVSNTLTTLVPGDGYIGIVPTASLWEIPQA